ncbi:MAG: hypothetical protein AAF480_19385, partial [Actinomycetota bacterium]
MRIPSSVLVVLVMICSACGSGDGASSEPAADEPAAAVDDVDEQAGTDPTPLPTAQPTATPAPTPTPEPTATPVPVVDLAGYSWRQVTDGAPWGGRAGLRIAEVDGSVYLFGGRTPRDSTLPGDSDIFSDVWRSDDLGATWDLVLESGGDHWSPRAYFQSVVKDGFIYVIGGQDFGLEPNPFCALLEQGLEPPPGLGIDPDAPCPEFLPTSEFFNDVWR